MTSSISAAEMEQVEADSYADYEDAASPEAKAVLGTKQLRIGGGVALAVPNDPSGFWSKAVGLGFTEPVTASLVERIIGFYREQGMSSATLQIAPDVLPDDWADTCAKLNISRSSAWVKLVGDLRNMTEAVTRRGAPGVYLDTGLRLETLPTDRAREWAAVTFAVFGLPAEHQIEMGVGSVGRPGWHALAVFEHDDIVGCASLRVAGRTGHLFGGATLPRARRRGAQSALIAARAVAAQAAGCDWLVAETPAEGPGEHNSSLHNMIGAGMGIRYERPSWTWRAAAA